MNKHLKIGFIFTAIGKFSNVIISLIVNAVLSRLLTPIDYGVVAIVQVFIIFFQLIVEAGMGPAIIQNKNLDKNDISSLFNFSAIFALILAILFGMFGKVLTIIYNNEIYSTISWVQAISIFFSGLNVIPTAELNKTKQFKLVNFVQIFGNFIGGMVGIVTAFKGFGVYSLIINAITTTAFSFLLNFKFSKIRLTCALDIDPMKRILSFSLNQFGFNFINYFSRNSDNILVGKFMGPVELGNYSKAYQLLMMPNNVLLGIINPVLQPVLSDYQNDVKKIRNIYLKIVHFLALIGVSLSVFLSMFAKEIIFFLFGNQWSDAVFPFRVLALTVWIQMTLSSTGAIFQSRNKARELMVTGVYSAVILISSIIVGIVLDNLNSLSICLAIGFLVNFFVNFIRVTKIVLEYKFNLLMKEFLVPFVIGFVNLFILSMLKNIVSESINSVVYLVIQGLGFIISFSALCCLFGEIKNIKYIFK